MAEAAVAVSTPALTPAQLAARHGLRVAGERPGLVAYTRQLWAYRHFIVSFSGARLAAGFATDRLGRLWQVLTPLVNAAVYFMIFGVALGTQRGIHNFPAYLCAGIFLFGYTQQAVLSGTKSITDNLGLIRALHFPRASLPIALTLTELQELLASVAVLLVIVTATGEPITVEWLLLIPILILQSLFNTGMALAMARLGAKLTDLKQIMPFILRTWMYASGVFYAVTMFSDHLPRYVANVMQANPLLIFIELARDVLLETPPPPGMSINHMWMYAGGWALVVSVFGYVYFWRGEQEYGRG